MIADIGRGGRGERAHSYSTGRHGSPKKKERTQKYVKL